MIEIQNGFVKLPCVGGVAGTIVQGAAPALVYLGDISSVGPTVEVLVPDDSGMLGQRTPIRIVTLRNGTCYAVDLDVAKRLEEILIEGR